MEFINGPTLFKLVETRSDVLPEQVVAEIARDLCIAIAHCHAAGVLHRDIKSSNVVIRADSGTAVLLDFGLARALAPQGAPSAATDSSPPKSQPLTPHVVSRWYRAPELLLGSTTYGEGVDLWALGCLLCECLAGGTPLFPAESDLAQLVEIEAVLGSPRQDVGPGLSGLRDWGHMDMTGDRKGVGLKARLPRCSTGSIDFVSRLLRWDPAGREGAAGLLAHPWLGTGLGRGASASEGQGEHGASVSSRPAVLHALALLNKGENTIEEGETGLAPLRGPAARAPSLSDAVDEMVACASDCKGTVAGGEHIGDETSSCIVSMEALLQLASGGASSGAMPGKD